MSVTNDRATTVAQDTPALGGLFAAQRAAFQAQPFPDWDQRRAWLQSVREVLHAHEADLCAAITADFGCRPATETRLLELFPASSGIAYELRHGRRWMRSQRRFAGRWFLPARTELLPQPVGVVGIIVPWNYPLYLAVGPLTDALAAGNRVLIKMSEATPHFGALFAQLIERAFPAGEVRIVNGGPGVAAAFSALPFDHLLFTGSGGIARKVLHAAAEHLTPVTLELGGKSPAIIAPQADLARAAERIVYGKCVNAGQTCIAPDYVLLPNEQKDAFVAAARRACARMYPDIAQSDQYASIINAAHHARLTQMLADARTRGATVHALAPHGHPDDRVMAPALLTDVPEDAAIMHEEIFGPLLPVVTYTTLDEALAYVAARPHPLSLYLFAERRAVVREVLRRSLAGGVSINDTLCHIAQHHLPFGGVGASGMGAYHGEAGFRTFSKMKPVFHRSRFNALRWLNPPYGARVRWLLKFLLRH